MKVVLMSSDAQLVRETIAGKTEAFAQIVERYKALVSSIAYNCVGHLAESEEIAQEVFLTAWREMKSLREPEKLRSWLCGIARRMAANRSRCSTRNVLHGAAPLEVAENKASAGTQPTDAVITHEEESLMWHALEQIPENYREPLILYYREENSLQKVAAALEISEEAARQRLSRGRKLLQEQVATLVESALRRSTPGRAFTFGVISALPLFGVSTAAATAGAGAAKGTAAAQGAAMGAIAGALLGPAVGIMGAWFGVKASLANAKSEREKRFIKKWTLVSGLYVAAFLLALSVPLFLLKDQIATSPRLGIFVWIGLPAVYVVGLMALIFYSIFAQNKIRREEMEKTGDAGRLSSSPNCLKEFRSKATFLGLPLLHVKMGRGPGERVKPAVGWIAVGDVSVGLLFAFGGISIGGLSFGGLSLGLISIGGLAVGGAALGGGALGWLAAGGLAVGYYAVGGAALAWKAAIGGFAAAHHFAVGGQAIATFANDQTAREAISKLTLMTTLESWMKPQGLIASLVWLPVTLVIVQSIMVFRKKKQVQ